MNEIIATGIMATATLAGPIVAALISRRRLAEASQALSAFAVTGAVPSGSAGDSVEEASERLEELVTGAHAMARTLSGFGLLVAGIAVFSVSGYLGARVLSLPPEAQTGPAMIVLAIVAGGAVAVSTLTAATLLAVGVVDRIARRLHERIDAMRVLEGAAGAQGLSLPGATTAAVPPPAVESPAERRRRRRARRSAGT